MKLTNSVCSFCQEGTTDNKAGISQNKCVHQCPVHQDIHGRVTAAYGNTFETCLSERIASGKDPEEETPEISLPVRETNVALANGSNSEGHSSDTTLSSLGALLSRIKTDNDSDVIDFGSGAPSTGTEHAIREPSSQLESAWPLELELEIELITGTDDDDSVEQNDEQTERGEAVGDNNQDQLNLRSLERKDHEAREDNDQRQEDGGENCPLPHVSVIAGVPTMYKCNICRKQFKTKSNMKYHKYCETGREKQYECKQCGRRFKRQHHYDYHLSTHTGRRPHICSTCGKGFIRRADLTRHTKSHTGAKSFICVECNGAYASAQSLKVHRLVHTGESPFACNVCDRRFRYRESLMRHVSTHTGERPFICEQCGKRFVTKRGLGQHLKTHSSQRPYECTQCSKRFTEKNNLQHHLLIHLGEWPFKCPVCSTPFRRKDRLCRHIKRMHQAHSTNEAQEVVKSAVEHLKTSTEESSIQNIPDIKY